LDEFAIIDRFFAGHGIRRRDVSLSIGDDAAVVSAAPGRQWVVTVDVLNSGVHFPPRTDPAAVGHKALAVNLSDVAAMGATPAWATMGLTLPEPDEDWLDAFSSGFFALADRFNVELIGGDVTRGPLSTAVQVIGEVGSEGYLTRSGARDGDIIYVSGTLGDAAIGLRVADGTLVPPDDDAAYFLDRLNRPWPRIELGRVIAGLAHAAIDLSDGLASDLRHICERSGVGAAVDVDRLPLSHQLRRCSADIDWETVVTFGDDYELCFTVPRANAARVEQRARELGVSISPIGRVSGNELIWMYEGEPFDFDEQGYQHFR